MTRRPSRSPGEGMLTRTPHPGPWGSSAVWRERRSEPGRAKQQTSRTRLKDAGGPHAPRQRVSLLVCPQNAY